MIETFVELLDRIHKIHACKNQDYAGNGNPFENFERSAEVMSWFNDARDKAFVNLIATKLARLATLLNKDGAPLNESIQDSFDDLTTYCGLWGSYREHLRRQANRSAPPPVPGVR